MSLTSWLQSLRSRCHLSRSRSRQRAGGFRGSRDVRPLSGESGYGAECLEARVLPTVSALLIGTELNITAGGTDSVTVRANVSGFVEVLDQNGVLTTMPSVSASAVQALTVTGGDHANVIDLSGVTAALFTALPSIQVSGGDGNDLITGSPDLANSLNGGDGSDVLLGGSGNDTLNGGNGADAITGGVGNDSLLGGDGADTLSGDAGLDTLEGGNGADLLSAGDDHDSVNGGNGADNLDGGLGNDTLNGDGGSDTITGGADNDTILGGAENDSLLGGSGNDSILAQAGNDTVDGEAGLDTLSGGDGADSLSGSADDDTISGDTGNDTLNGDDGNDSLFGGGGNDSLNGGVENDNLMGQGGNDTVLGGGGSDQLNGGDGSDFVSSDDGADPPPTPFLSISDVTVAAEGDNPLFRLAFSDQVPLTSGIQVDDSTAADFDGDGLLDVAFTDTQGSVRVRLNQGGLSFAPAVQYITGLQATGLASGDVNGDGNADIVVMNYADDTVSVLINNGGGSGTFTTRPAFASGGDANAYVALGDLDGDGDLDMAMSANGAVLIHRNTNGVFSLASTISTPVSTGRIRLSDVDRNGFVDIVTVDESTGDRGVAVIRNNGSFSFTAATLAFASPRAGFQLQVVDVNGDNYPDILTQERQASFDLLVSLNDRTGNFLAPITYAVAGNGPFASLQAADVDNDGDVDCISHPQVGGTSISVLINDGNGVFATEARFTFPVPIQELTVGDFDNDLDIDIALPRIANPSVRFGVLENDPDQVVATVGVTLSQASAVPVTVMYSTASGTATLGVDFPMTTGQLTFAPGQLSQTLNIGIVSDHVPESLENFFVNLTNATNATIGDSQSQILIQDDDGGAAVVPTLAITDALPVTEGLSGTTNATFTVTLSAASASPITVSFGTTDGSAQAGFDYNSSSGTLTFAPGVTSQTLTVAVRGDQVRETDETFFMNLFNPSGVVLSDSQGQATITDDDGGVIPDDTLIGSDGSDTLVGSIGNDIVNGGSGNDSIDAGLGNDSVLGGSGNDTLFGNDGHDTLSGQGGNDLLDGGSGDDQLVWGGASDGKDTLLGTAGFDTAVVNGTGAADSLTVSQNAARQLTVSQGAASLVFNAVSLSNVVLNGNGGNDSITIGSLPDTLAVVLTVNGGDGNDTLSAAGASLGMTRLQINGNAGNDSLIGSVSGDALDGGDGDDTLLGGLGNDVLLGGAGIDRLTGDAGDDSLNGGDDNDVLRGLDGNDSIVGGNGDDSVLAGNDNDTVSGDAGADTLNGEAGNDSLSGSFGADLLSGGDGADTLDGGTESDSLTGNAGDDLLRGGDGNDTIDAGDGNDTIIGGDGDDVLTGGNGNDAINGSDGNDVLNGGAGNDSLLGGNGNDTLRGGSGNDVLLGGDGDDNLDGQGGSDTLAGNQGVDTLNNTLGDLINESFALPAALLTALEA